MLRFLILFLVLFSGVEKSFGQVSIDVESDEDITVTVLSPLVFGDLIPNRGGRLLNIHDPDISVIEITGAENRNINVDIQFDGTLKQIDGPATLPIQLGAAYANMGRDNIADAVYFDGVQVRFPMLNYNSVSVQGTQTQQQNGESVSKTSSYIYLFGSADADNVPPGEYTGSITVIVSYD